MTELELNISSLEGRPCHRFAQTAGQHLGRDIRQRSGTNVDRLHGLAMGELLSLVNEPFDEWSIGSHVLIIGRGANFLHRERQIRPNLSSELGAEMRVVFVCTGNICRSPFAEYLARQLSNGEALTFTSAGTFARPGNPASSRGTAVAAELGVDLALHGANPLTGEVVAAADLLFAMEDEHLTAVLELDPGARVELLRPDGEAVPDPYGEDRQTYLDIYALIDTAVRQRLAELNSPQSSAGENPKLGR